MYSALDFASHFVIFSFASSLPTHSRAVVCTYLEHNPFCVVRIAVYPQIVSVRDNPWQVLVNSLAGGNLTNQWYQSIEFAAGQSKIMCGRAMLPLKLWDSLPVHLRMHLKMSGNEKYILGHSLLLGVFAFLVPFTNGWVYGSSYLVYGILIF